MEQLDETPELLRLRQQLLTVSPPRALSADDAAARVLDVEWRARLLRQRQRFTTALAVTALCAAVAVLLVLRRPTQVLPALAIDLPVPAQATEPAQVTHAATMTVENRQASASLFDLGPGQGKVLVRPGTRFDYLAQTRTLTLHEGSVVAHILPGGHGFQVRTRDFVVRDIGTLFAVDDTGQVQVWQGVVEREPLAGGPTVTMTADERLGPLPGGELAWLGVRADAVVPHRPQGVERTPRPTEPEPPRPSERQLVLQAQVKLAAGDATAALDLLAVHAQQFPDGLLAEEAHLLELRALRALGRQDALATAARRFLARYPGSGAAPEVRELARQAERK